MSLTRRNQKRSRRSLFATAVVSGLGVGFLSGCLSPSVMPDGTPAVTFIVNEAARIARVCAQEDFDKEKVRTRLISEGFVEQNRPGIRQLERFPKGYGPLTQGITVPSSKPCLPHMDASFARESLTAVGMTLIVEGFTLTPNKELVRGNQRIRLTASHMRIGGTARIYMEPL